MSSESSSLTRCGSRSITFGAGLLDTAPRRMRSMSSCICKTWWPSTLKCCSRRLSLSLSCRSSRSFWYSIKDLNIWARAIKAPSTPAPGTIVGGTLSSGSNSIPLWSTSDPVFSSGWLLVFGGINKKNCLRHLIGKKKTSETNCKGASGVSNVEIRAPKMFCRAQTPLFQMYRQMEA